MTQPYAVFHWQIFATNRQKPVISIGPFKNPPKELTDFERFAVKICQWKTALRILDSSSAFKLYFFSADIIN